MHERTFDGIWWVPGGAAAPVGGRLTFTSGKGLRLYTTGELVTQLEAASGVKIPFVFGTISSIETGNDITLHDVSRTETSSQGRFVQQHFTPRLAVLGAHVEHTKVSNAEVSFNHLAAWLGIVHSTWRPETVKGVTRFILVIVLRTARGSFPKLRHRAFVSGFNRVRSSHGAAHGIGLFTSTLHSA
jgi:hypothetical protein